MIVRVEDDPPHKVEAVNVRKAGPEINAQSLNDLDRELGKLTKKDLFSGVVLFAKKNVIMFYEGYGLADRERGHPNTQETRFDLGSINKLFTSTVILRLVQDSRIALSDPIGKYLNGFEAEVATKVTVGHLLRHRSGFGDYSTHPEFEADPKRFKKPDDFLPLARDQKLTFEPGTQYRYSNMGFVLLGVIIERVTGRGYHKVVDDVVFKPAKMITAGPTGGSDAARRYHRIDDRLSPFDSVYSDFGTPAGGGFATAMDLYRFINAFLDYRLLDKKYADLMINGFREGTEDLPEEIKFSGGAPGVNATFLARTDDRQLVIILANIDPLAIEAMARGIQDLIK